MDPAVGSRISELIALRRADILLLPDYFRLNFTSRKNKKRREPNMVFVAPARSWSAIVSVPHVPAPVSMSLPVPPVFRVVHFSLTRK